MFSFYFPVSTFDAKDIELMEYSLGLTIHKS